MSEYLFNIAESFEITGRGLVLASDLKIRQISQLVSPGHLLEFRLASGTSFRSRVISIDLSTPFSPNRPLGFQVEPIVRRADLPIGTAVWLVADSEAHDD
jgi:hypothetical protein